MPRPAPATDNAPGQGAPLNLDAQKQMIAKERGRFAVMEEEFANSRVKLESDFEAKLPTLLSDEEKEALDLDGDPVKSWQILSAKHQELVDDKIAEQEKALDEFEDKLEAAESALPYLEAEAKFAAEHPDVDMDELTQFFENELSLSQKEKLREDAGEDKFKYVQGIADLRAKANGTAAPEPGEGEKEEDPNLPADLHRIAGESGDPTVDGEKAQDEDFLTKIGMG